MNSSTRRKYYEKIPKLSPHYNQSSEMSHALYSVPIIIKKLKMYLMSRSVNKQMHAINTINNQLRDKESPVTSDFLIQTDIPGLLCDVMNNHNPPLIEKVFSCLLELSRNELFYDLKHSAIVIETTCRTVRILSKNEANMTIIHSGLKLLSKTLSMSVKETTINLGQILGLGKDLLFSPLFQRVHISVMVVIRSVLKIKEFNHDDLLPVVYKALSLLYKLYKNIKVKFNKQIALASEFICFSLRRLCTLEDNISDSPKITDLVWKLIQSSVVTFIMEVELKKCHIGFMRRILTCLLDAYKYTPSSSKRLNQLSNLLASKGFLTLLPSFNLHFNDKSMHCSTVSLLSHILVTLADSCLKPSDYENQLIVKGLMVLPADCSVWPEFLAQPQAYKVHHAIIVHLYFVLLCSKSFNKFPSLLPALCSFLKSQHSSPSPALLKAIWLPFAVSSLSQSPQDSRRDNKKQMQTINNVLIRWLCSVSLNAVCTHHSALLVWVFSPQVSNRNLQINMVILWLGENNQVSMKEIELLVLNNRDAALCLLDVLSCCSMEVMEKVLTLLKAVKSQGLVDMSVNMWTSLSRTMSLLTTPRSDCRVRNVCCMVFQACKMVPATPDTVLMLRVGYQLLRAFRRPDTDPDLTQALHAQLYKLASTIVIKMHQVKDYRVLEVFLQDSVLLRALLSSLSSDSRTAALHALRLLSYLQYFQKMHNIQVKSLMYVSGETLLQLMSCSRAETVFACMQLFSVLYTSSNTRPLIALPSNTACHLIQALYLEFQALTLKTNNSWRCQRLMLEFCKVHNPEMEVHLLTQPWTYIVIHLAIQKNGMTNADVLELMSVWLAGLQEYKAMPRDRYPRALCQDMLTNTLTDIATGLVRSWSHGALAKLHNDIAVKILNLGTNIPDHVIKPLQEKIGFNYTKQVSWKT